MSQAGVQPTRLHERETDRSADGVVVTRVSQLWLLRVAWMSLPVTAGPAASASIAGWTSASRIVAEVLLWLAWAVGLLATWAPRPLMLTMLRTIAPTFFLLAAAGAADGRPSIAATVGGVVATAIAALLTSTHDIAIASANAAAYGDERRYPLRVPPALFLGPLPLARALVVAGISTPALLFAEKRVLLGSLSTIVGAVLVVALGRALHGLSRRWVVLVPAGLVVVDPLTLSDPVLFLRERIVALTPLRPGPAPPGATDLRLGAALGSLVLTVDEPGEIGRLTRARRGVDMVQTAQICIAAVRRDDLLRRARERRLRVRDGQAAMPPPTSTSSS
jgi:hypothetical protein